MYFKALLPVISDFNSTMSVSKLKFSGWFRGLLCLDIFYKYILIYTTIPSILGLYNYILYMHKYIYTYILYAYIYIYIDPIISCIVTSWTLCTAYVFLVYSPQQISSSNWNGSD